LSDSIIQLIPPRPDGYSYNRELFNRRTGLAFDPLAAAETAADFPLSFLFNTSRLNRMVQYKATYNGLGVDEMITLLINKFWKSPSLKGLEGLIQKQNQQLLLTYLLAVSVNDDASFATRAQVMKATDDLKAFANLQLKTTTEAESKGYLLLTLERMKAPEKAKSAMHEAMPPGSPIGCGFEQ
ncbi:MAG: hypothetical protein ABIO98_01305, partial [Chitinophagales bacterium]